MDFNKKNVGWLYKTEEAPAKMVVDFAGMKKLFEDSEKGAELVRDHITGWLGRDDWTLLNMGFLGYRIQVPKENGTRR